MNNDLISREALKEEIRREVGENQVGVFVAKRIFKLIDNAPTVKEPIQALARIDEKGNVKIEPLRSQGEWRDHKLRNDIVVEHAFKCSVCKQDSGLCYPTDYCPNCGADMRKGGAE